MDTPTPTETDKKHGGSRANAGPTPNDVKDYQNLAAEFIDYVESVLKDTYGDNFLMGKDEKKRMKESLGKVFKRWEVTGAESPYFAFAIAAMCYAFKPGRMEVQTATSGIAKLWQTIKTVKIGKPKATAK